MGEAVIANDAVWPRDEQHRYRVYRVQDGLMSIVAATPDPAGVGVAICRLALDGEIGQDDRVGVMDVLAHGHDMTGKWLVNPYATGR